MEVLVWIVAGCPGGVMTDTAFETSAAALASRGLVVVRRQRGRWTAEATEDGRYFAEHRRYPPSPDDWRRRTGDRRTGSGGPVEQLIAELTGRGSGPGVGVMDCGRADMLIRSAIRHGKVPQGH